MTGRVANGLCAEMDDSQEDALDRLEAALDRIEHARPAPQPALTTRLDGLIAQLQDVLAPTMP